MSPLTSMKSSLEPNSFSAQEENKNFQDFCSKIMELEKIKYLNATRYF